MTEINEIFKQFEHGDGRWPQFIDSIRISNIHGWTGQEMQFKFPVVAVVGENGMGKSTFLKAAACAYHNKRGKDFYPSKMFISTHWDESALSGAIIEYKVKLGESRRTLRWKKTSDWGFSPKQGKPERDVYFLDISRTVPLDATAGYAKIANQANWEAAVGQVLNEESLRGLSFVLGQKYVQARFANTEIDEKHKVGILTKRYGEISQFHQGAGEDSMLDVFSVLQDMPDYSLLIIDEVENSLHPRAQRRFVQYLLSLARKKKLQIILSTHSPFVLDELPPIARIMLIELADRKEIVYSTSSEYALATIDDGKHPELYVYVEDEEAVELFWALMKFAKERYGEIAKKISTSAIGAYSVVKTFYDLGKNGKLPYKSMAIVDGDKREEADGCLAFPSSEAPEKAVFNGLKAKEWNNLENRFGIGAGTLYKVLNDAILLQDHHQWTTYVGDQIKKSKADVWSIMVDEWCKQCLSEAEINDFIQCVLSQLD